MLDELFDFEDSDLCGTGINFYRCTLKMNIGEFLKGSKHPTIYVNFYEGKMEFYKPDQIIIFKLKVEVVS